MPGIVLPLKGVFVDGSAPVNFIPSVQPLRIPRETNATVRVGNLNSAGAAVALAGAACAMAVKQYPDDPAPLFTKTGLLPAVGNTDGPWDLTALTLTIAGQSVALSNAGSETGPELQADVAAAMVTAGRPDVVVNFQPNGAPEIASATHTPFTLAGTALTTLGFTAGTYSAAPSSTGSVDFAFVPADTEAIGDGPFCYDVRVTFPDTSVVQTVPLSDSNLIVAPSAAA